MLPETETWDKTSQESGSAILHQPNIRDGLLNCWNSYKILIKDSSFLRKLNKLTISIFHKRPKEKEKVKFLPNGYLRLSEKLLSL